MNNKQLLNRLIKARGVCTSCGLTYNNGVCHESFTYESIQTDFGTCDICRGKHMQVSPVSAFNYLQAGRDQLYKLIREEIKAKVKPVRIRIKAKKKPHQTSINELKKALWTLTSKLIRSQSNKCYTCGRQLEYNQRSACHFWSKGGHGGVRFDLDNLRSGCNTCNTYLSGNLAEFAVRLRKEIGEERFEALNQRAHKPHQFKREELELMITERKEILTKL